MENQFFVDSGFLSPEALEKKRRLETDPSFRKDHMEYLPGMEQIRSDVRRQVTDQMESYDYTKYTARDVRAALDHPTCSIEDFKGPAVPGGGAVFGGDGAAGAGGDRKAFRQYGLPFYAALYRQLL